MIVVDTAVLLYAVGEEHAFREPSRRLVDAVADRQVDATTSVSVIQEFAHVCARRRSRDETTSVARRYAALFAPLLVSTAGDLDPALRLFQRHEQLGSFDAVLAATAMRAGATAFVSTDAGFTGIRGLRHVVPGTVEFDALVQSG